MAIVQAYQCPYTKRLFDINDKLKYIRHLKKLAKTTYPLKMAARFSSSFDISRFMDSVESLEHLQSLLKDNFYKYLSFPVISAEFQVVSRYADDFRYAFKHGVLTSCHLTYNSQEPWIKNRVDSNYSLLGAEISLLFVGDEYTPSLFDFGHELLSEFHMDSLGGSTSGSESDIPQMSYNVQLKAIDWKFVAFNCIDKFVLSKRNTNIDWYQDYEWNVYFRPIIEKHWPGIFPELTSILPLYTSLEADILSLSSLLMIKLPVGIHVVEQINTPLSNIEFL